MSDGTFTLANAHTFVGTEMALTDWVFVDQIQVNVFGEVTRWTPWMHSDPVRCEAESPYGGAIMHGFMMVSLITHFLELANLRPLDASHALNYGMDKVRILRPVVISDGVRLRDRITLLGVEDKDAGKRLFKTGHLIEADDAQAPAAYIEYLNFWFPQ